MYHIYLNRNGRWTLSKNILEKLVHMHDFDLTNRFPDIRRFIYLCVNEKTINFLVQMDNLSYGVVFCSVTNDCITNEKLKLKLIELPRAQQLLTIYSAFIKSLNQDFFLLMIFDCYAIYYVADNHELIIVTNNSISSINLNQ
ncbi:unnamed protein product [Rotaria sordida]|uniref:Uncharacterized protein n=1 Tax=Rotaria sordida TaxID=392033 RepID=A0A816BGQ3_9BILA|nr:unnamed protein product [Rotaria sordida]CAF1610192.1 unnamed protein product [Rotaria sordida]